MSSLGYAKIDKSKSVSLSGEDIARLNRNLHISEEDHFSCSDQEAPQGRAYGSPDE
jgi:hypothetical protein